MKGYLQEIFSSIQGEGSLMGRRQIFIRMAGCPLSCKYCIGFKSGSDPPRIWTTQGEKEIWRVQPGEELVTLTPWGKLGITQVKQVFIREVALCLELEFQDHPKLYVTPEHPLLVGGSWVEAGSLAPGKMITAIDHQKYHEFIGLPESWDQIELPEKCTELCAIASLSWIKSANAGPNRFRVWNLKCEPYHTYIVNGILVHNCDTPRYPRPEFCQVERSPGAGIFKLLRNPLGAEQVARELESLLTPDLHSVSITGGEPLAQPEFLKQLSQELSSRGLRIYLETAGIDSQRFSELLDFIQYAAIDIKLPDHQAARDWEALLAQELNCIKISVDHGVQTIVKIVILESIDPGILDGILSQLPPNLDLVLQPVTPVKGVSPPNPQKLLQLSQLAARYLDPSRIMILPQIHRILGLK